MLLALEEEYLTYRNTADLGEKLFDIFLVMLLYFATLTYFFPFEFKPLPAWLTEN